MANYLIDSLYKNVRAFHDHEFCRFKKPGDEQWLSTTWAEFLDAVERCACGFMMLGLAEKSKVALCSPNRPEVLQAEYACFMHRMSGVPIYAYCSQDQFDFIMSNSSTRVVVAGDKEQYKMARAYAATHPGALDNIILLCDPAGVIDAEDTITLTWQQLINLDAEKAMLSGVQTRTARAEHSDMASLIYTSGTTGDPKGVILTVHNFEAAISEHLKSLPTIKSGELSLCFLPMSHVFEKAWTFFCVAKGIRVAFCYDARLVESVLREVQPNLMCCVPRFWEKIYTEVVHKFHHVSWWKRLMMSRAFAVGAKVNLHYRCLDLSVPYLLKKEYDFWDRKIFAKVRNRIGIPCPNFFPTSGAALSDKIIGVMRKMGIDLIFGYGMTETTATVSCYPTYDFEIGTVGVPMPMVSVKIADDGEILVKGPTVTPGYYHNRQANEAAFTSDGYLRTGDAGFINSQGALVLTHRKKDLFKTSTGKYISPQSIESLLMADPYINQVVVIGDMRKYVAALIVPNFSKLRLWAEKHNILDLKTSSLCSNQKVIDFMLSRVREHQEGLASFEQIKKITLLPEPFTQESGELTNTLKLRRDVVNAHYSRQIENMYPPEYLNDAPIFNNRHR